ncbi:hypothetical protein MASR1M59_08270 [Melaminivora sp.]
MKPTIALLLCSLLALSGCNTWTGVKQDAKQAGQATGKGIERAGEKIQDIAK